MRLISDDTWGILTVWQEARGEPPDGKVAVAEVILRRAKRRFFSDGTVAGTVLKAWQFSGWNTTDPNRIPAALLDEDDPEVKDCIEAWEKAKTGTNLTRGAVHYYNPKVASPDWAKNAAVVASIGSHLFVIPTQSGGNR